MSDDDAPKKILITPDDVNAKAVDDALSRQMSFGMPAAAEKERSAWYYKSWFVLMMAGALGGFGAWAVIEPFYDDLLTIRGNVESVDAAAVMPGQDFFLGRMSVSGTSVWLVAKDGKMDRGDGVWRPLDPSAFSAGEVVDVSGEAAVAQNAILVATRVRLRPGDTETYPPAELASMGTRDFITSVLLVFPLVAGLVGLAIGAADGLLSRAYSRATLGAGVGLAMGLVAGLLASVAAHVLYALLGTLMQPLQKDGATSMSAGAFILQMMSRGVAWALAGIAMGMGQGIALRSRKVFLNGVIGGVVGGLLGGLLFDPIHSLFGGDDAAASRGVGFAVIGLVTGLMIGIVELIAREAWLKMLAGPLAGKEFVLYKDPTSIGSSPKREVYLFKDPEVEPTHALIHRVGEGYEIEDLKTPAGVLLNGRKVSRQRLKSQDQIRIGSTILLFTMKEE